MMCQLLRVFFKRYPHLLRRKGGNEGAASASRAVATLVIVCYVALLTVAAGKWPGSYSLRWGSCQNGLPLQARPISLMLLLSRLDNYLLLALGRNGCERVQPVSPA